MKAVAIVSLLVTVGAGLVAAESSLHYGHHYHHHYHHDVCPPLPIDPIFRHLHQAGWDGKSGLQGEEAALGRSMQGVSYMLQALFKQGLHKYSVKDFDEAHYPAYVRSAIKQLQSQEDERLHSINHLLGISKKGHPACEYKFDIGSVDEFLHTARAVKELYVSDVLGGLLAATDPFFHRFASTSATEAARQAAHIAGLLHQDTSPTLFDTLLHPEQAYALYKHWVKSCPYKTAASPFPHLTVKEPTAALGRGKRMHFGVPQHVKGPFYAHFLGNNNVVVRKLDHKKGVRLPHELNGVVYVFLADTAEHLQDCNTVAGPFVMFLRDSKRHHDVDYAFTAKRSISA